MKAKPPTRRREGADATQVQVHAQPNEDISGHELELDSDWYRQQ